ncbi:MAG: hypothetical protein JHC93_06830 [Parachlamydiales bacterium]|nr:hypothetical protein [Parachlamydiales bacterium]
MIKKPAIYAYGLSKSLTWMLFQHYCNKIDIPLAKFVIPNPFGSLEESSRLIPYLMNSWLTNQTPVIDSPSYIRDNIPVTLLAKSYAWLINNLDINKVFQPSGYVGSQKKFVQKVMTEMSSRFNKKLNVTFKKQSFFTEPRIRTNSDNLNWQEMGWNESFFWDQLAEYYQTIHGVAQTSLKKSELIIC